MAKKARNRVLGRKSSSFTLVSAMLLMLKGNQFVRPRHCRINVSRFSIASCCCICFLFINKVRIFCLHLFVQSSSQSAIFRNDGVGLGERGLQWTEVISWEPRATLYHNFLSKEECEYLISLAKPYLAKSSVVDSNTGKSMDSSVRTSFGMFLNRGQDKVVRSIEKRIADFSFIPVEHGEGLQILRYELGQKYEPHFDYFVDELNTKNGGNRMATLLMYLSDVEEGGETVFPNVKGNISAVPWWNELSACGKRGLSVKPKMGDAILFWSMKPDATLDPLSLHGACPVIKGTKWSCAKWMHVNEYKV
ncbi:PREDICTED: probable prolyl 4-hydroxylase 3 [Nelumbo nucifera]|uniref:procollagen-proline 4-dioxygenase n=1 Tax=Nelumbo nucifera TaxID=4432 RepID=A0A1U8Q6B9_NELNU|nr:PREDICTED: probable prolyl 4-hydroxylase 3 [Nelumbo nucifera]